MTAGKPALGSTVYLPNHASRLDDTARDALFHRLEAECAVVQVIEQQPHGPWQQIHCGGSLAGVCLSEVPQSSSDLAEILAWLAEPDARRAAAALQEPAGGSASWRGQLLRLVPGSDPCWVDIDVHADSSQASITRGTIVARDRGRERSIQTQADAFRERVGIVESAAELGIIGYHAGTQTIQLDAAAAALHGLTEPGARALPVDDWDFTMRNELDLVFTVTQCAWPYLKRRGGVIINIASIAATNGAGVPERLWPCPGRLATDDRVYVIPPLRCQGWGG